MCTETEAIYSHWHRQRGASAIEFTLIAIPILLVGLGIIELGRWFFIKQAISLALLEAGRAGITAHAHPLSIESAFEQGLLPLFASAASNTSRQKLERTFTQQQARTGTTAWQIVVLTPNQAMFQDFSSPIPVMPVAGGQAAINNNYQAEQHLRYTQKGWPEGRGPVSGSTIFEANTLQLHLTYQHRPLIPGISGLLQLLSKGASGYRQKTFAGGYLPVEQSLQLTMQSHPIRWPPLSLKVHWADQTPTSIEPNRQLPLLPPCLGVWCPRPNSTNSPITTTGADSHALPGQPSGDGAAYEPGLPAYHPYYPPGESGANPGSAPNPSIANLPVSVPDHGTDLPGDNHPACGISLCCIGA